ncbi:MAG: hypothetical protein ACI9S9_003376 [Planctomycetota bacterium]|jgi:hypothetical protein
MSRLLAALASCSRAPTGLAVPMPDDLIELGCDIAPPSSRSDPCVYLIKVTARDFELELDAGSGTETWGAPEGALVSRFWEEEQSMTVVACPGPRSSATVSIRQSIVDGVRLERLSAVEINASYRLYDGDSVGWRHAARTDRREKRWASLVEQRIRCRQATRSCTRPYCSETRDVELT